MTTFLLQHLWLEMLLLAIGITAVFLQGTVHRVPRVVMLLPPSPPGLNPPSRNSMEMGLQALEFHHIGDYDITIISTAKMNLRVYLSPDQLTSAGLMEIQTIQKNFNIIEFVTRLRPQGSIGTGNFELPNVFCYPASRIVVRAPWKKNAEELWELHLALCSAVRECSYYPTPFLPEEVASRVTEVTRQDLEFQVKKGRMKRVGEDEYRLTLLGSLLGTPRVWWHMLHGGLFSWYHPSDASLRKRVRGRLRDQ